PRYHFDSLAPAFLSAMMVTTLDGWVEIFHKATNAYKVDYQPSQNCNLIMLIMLIMLVVLIMLILLILFILLIVGVFKSIK
ncbi:unnamed protein product, partial [Laminaria digitata]